ncbi:transposase [Streptosporangium sp. G11]|uniref:transposase n=1 Tax=Streptosporangium sp. G11 TaxID=3436926 RepID=UPI003EBD099B
MEIRTASSPKQPAVPFTGAPAPVAHRIERAITANLPFAWVTGDEAYGDNGPLRRFLEARQLNYVLAVARAHRLTSAAGAFRAGVMAKKVPESGFEAIPAGIGTSPWPCSPWPISPSPAPCL